MSAGFRERQEAFDHCSGSAASVAPGVGLWLSCGLVGV